MAETKARGEHSHTLTLAERLQVFFKSTAPRIARATKFVQRKSKLTATKFAQTWIMGFATNPEASLGELAEDAHELGVSISAQGLDQRLTDQAVSFLKQLFSEALHDFRNDLALELPLLQQFSAIYLLDSSVIALPDNLQTEFAGCGGDGPHASAKTQLLFELLRGNLHALILQPGRSADSAYQAHLAHVQAGALFLQDLGYFVVAHFRQIDAQKAYFLSRFNTQTAIYDAHTHVRLNLLDELRGETAPLFERDVLIGVDEQLPCRAIFIRLPQEAADRRRQKAIEAAQRRGQTLSPRTLALMDWNIYVTNVPATMLSPRQVAILYGVRWQIELIFKLWKSYCGLERIAGLRRARVLCELYGKMIGIVLLHWLIAPLRLGERELSAVKACQLWHRYARRIARALKSPAKLSSLLETLLERMQCAAVKDRRQTRLSTLQQLKREAVPSLG